MSTPYAPPWLTDHEARVSALTAGDNRTRSLVHYGSKVNIDGRLRFPGKITICVLRACSSVPHPAVTHEHMTDWSCAKPALNPRVRGSSPWRRTCPAMQR